MGFLTPWFLAGAVAIGLPVWLHLLRQHKNIPLPFSSLMFFEKRTQSSIKHRRLRHLILLALRLALLLLLALAFANPFIKRNMPVGASGNKIVVAAVDTSYSMRQGGQLDRAKQEASTLVTSVQSGDKGQVLAFDSSVQQMTQVTGDPAELRAGVAAIQPGDGRSSFGELARAVRSLAQSARAPLEVHLFSDLQKTSMPPGFADLQLTSTTRLILHPTAGAAARPNFAIETVSAPHRIYGAGKARVQATVAGFSTEKATRQVSLVLDNKVLETKPVTIPAGGRGSVEFLSLEAAHGFHKGEVRLEGGDGFPQDDHFLIAVERGDPRRVLFVSEPRGARNLLYYRPAIEASAESAFTLETATVDQAANLALTKFAFVALADIGAIPESFDQNLKQYLRGGGSLLVVLGSVAASQPRVPGFDEAVAESRYASRTGERFQSIASFDSSHPTLAKSNGLEGVKFYQTVKVEPGKSRVSARLADGTPLVLEKQVGEGLVMVFASTFDNIANDLPLHASFIPFVEQTAKYLARQQESLSNLAVGAYVELRNAQDRSTSVEVIDPQGKRALTLEQSTRAQNFRLPGEGFYELRRSNGRHDLIAVNADRRESDLEQIPKETLTLWQNTGQGAGAGEPGASPSSETEKPWSLWWYFVAALFAVALVESIFGARYLSHEAEDKVVEHKEAA